MKVFFKLAVISLFLVTYIWTITIAWAKAGGLTLVVSFLPLIGMVYWGYQEWSANGFTLYVVLVILNLLIDGLFSAARSDD